MSYLPPPKQVIQLAELLEWANASDSDDNDRPCMLAAQSGMYGNIRQALNHLISETTQLSHEDATSIEFNFGGNSSWADDIMIGIKEKIIDNLETQLTEESYAVCRD